MTAFAAAVVPRDSIARIDACAAVAQLIDRKQRSATNEVKHNAAYSSVLQLHHHR